MNDSSITTIAGEPRTETIERGIRIAVPVGVAVLTWLGLLLAVGLVLRIDSVSVLNLLQFVIVGVVFWPLWRVAPWREGFTQRVLSFFDGNRSALLAAAGLGVLPMLPGVPGLVASLLNLPYRGSGVLFGASLFYRERLGGTVARVLLRSWQWYLQALWLYILGSAVAALVRRLR